MLSPVSEGLWLAHKQVFRPSVPDSSCSDSDRGPLVQRLIDSFKISNGSIHFPSDYYRIRQAELERPRNGKNTDQDSIQRFLILFNILVLKPGHATHNF